MTTCLHCAHSGDLRANTTLAKLGLVRCSHLPEYQSKPFDRTCSRFKPAAPEVIKGRDTWRTKEAQEAVKRREASVKHGRG